MRFPSIFIADACSRQRRFSSLAHKAQIISISDIVILPLAVYLLFICFVDFYCSPSFFLCHINKTLKSKPLIWSFMRIRTKSVFLSKLCNTFSSAYANTLFTQHIAYFCFYCLPLNARLELSYWHQFGTKYDLCKWSLMTCHFAWKMFTDIYVLLCIPDAQTQLNFKMFAENISQRIYCLLLNFRQSCHTMSVEIKVCVL